METIEIRKLVQSEKSMAMDLAWEVFIEFEGPDYAQEGISHFRSFINFIPSISRAILPTN